MPVWGFTAATTDFNERERDREIWNWFLPFAMLLCLFYLSQVRVVLIVCRNGNLWQRIRVQGTLCTYEIETYGQGGNVNHLNTFLETKSKEDYLETNKKSADREFLHLFPMVYTKNNQISGCYNLKNGKKKRESNFVVNWYHANEIKHES